MPNKVLDACKYLQSDGHWEASLWLAKCRLPAKASYSSHPTTVSPGNSNEFIWPNVEFFKLVKIMEIHQDN